MLHIIFLILKILGFVILGILALAVLILALVLLCPLGYRVEASADNSLESLKGNVRFHWLLHLVSGEVSYEDSSLSWSVRAAWKKLDSGTETGQDYADARKDGADTRQNYTDARPDSAQTRQDCSDARQTCADENGDEAVRPARAAEKKEKTTEQEESDDTEQAGAVGGRNSGDRKRTEKSGRKKRGSFYSIYERVRQFWGKIKYTFQKIYDNIRSLRKKKDRLTAFVQNEIHKAAFARLRKETKKLLRSLCPEHAQADLEFGFSDPSHTGYALAGISMLYPFIGPHSQITPDFEQKVFKGSLVVKGRIRLVSALIFALNMFLDKNVRITFRHIRKFSL